jgi:hypothetical protein
MPTCIRRCCPYPPAPPCVTVCSCCVPQTLIMTLTSATCTCVDGVEITLLYSAGTGKWTGSVSGCAEVLGGDDSIYGLVECVAGSLTAYFSCNGPNTNSAAIPLVTCDPFLMEGDSLGGTLGSGPCCDSGTITHVVVTE